MSGLQVDSLLTRTQEAILEVLLRLKGQWYTQSQIVKLADIKRSTCHNSLKGLVKCGFVWKSGYENPARYCVNPLCRPLLRIMKAFPDIESTMLCVKMIEKLRSFIPELSNIEQRIKSLSAEEPLPRSKRIELECLRKKRQEIYTSIAKSVEDVSGENNANQ